MLKLFDQGRNLHARTSLVVASFCLTVSSQVFFPASLESVWSGCISSSVAHFLFHPVRPRVRHDSRFGSEVLPLKFSTSVFDISFDNTPAPGDGRRKACSGIRFQCACSDKAILS